MRRLVAGLPAVAAVVAWGLSVSLAAQIRPSAASPAGPRLHDPGPLRDDSRSAAAVRSYLLSRAPGLGAYQLELAAQRVSQRSRARALRFRPRFGEVRLLDGEIAAHFDASGRLVRVLGADPPHPPRTMHFRLDAPAAIAAAYSALGRTLRADPWIARQAPDAAGRYRLNGPAGEAFAERVWFNLERRAIPAWLLYLTAAGEFQEVVVDATDGALLRRRSLERDGPSSGWVFRAPDASDPATAAQSLEPLTGWPVDSGACPPAIYLGQFASGPAAGECWTTGVETVGNNVEACLDADGDNLCDRRAVAAGGVFPHAFSDSYGQFGDPTPDRDAAIVNAFYWLNAIHDWLYRLGFDESAGNFQADNFARGGHDGDPVRVDVHDGATPSNARFITAPDGIAARMNLGLFSGAQRDAAFDPDILIHEYVHGLTQRLVGGPNSVSALYLLQSGALGEGWSDALATSFTADPVFGEYVTRNSFSGIRSLPYDLNAYTFGQFGALRAAVIPGTGRIVPLPQVHSDGEIWGGVLWDLRTALGQDPFEQLVVEALTLTPPRPSMLDARDALLLAAELLATGGANGCGLWPVFALRGMGASAALNPIESGAANDFALSVYEAFDPPAACGGAAAGTLIEVLSEGAEADSDWTASGLWHRTTSAAAMGGYSWWFGRQSTGNYDTGARAFGDLISPPIDLTAASAAVLEWDQTFRGAGFGARVDLGGEFEPFLNVDSGRVWVSVDDATSWQLLTHIAHDTAGSDFVRFRINLRRFVGQVVRLRFDFDTFGDQDNQHQGWRIDDIRVSADVAPDGPVATPSVLSFAAFEGGEAPTAQALTVESSSGQPLAWTATAVPPIGWLSVAPAAGATPAAPAVRVDPAGLAPGTYSTRLEFGSAEAAVDVTLAVAPAPGAAAAWGLDETGAGPGIALADSVGANTALTVGRGSASIPGPSGAARLFNGFTDGAAAPASAAYSPLEITVRAWVRLRSYPSNIGMVVSNFGGANARGWYLAVNSDGRPLLMAAQPPSSTPWLVADASLEIDRWHMLTAVIDRLSGRARLYVDEQLRATANFPGLTPDPAAPLTIGKASWTDNYFFPGAIDAVEIRPYLRSAAGVATDFQQFTTPATPLRSEVGAAWPLDAHGVDASGNGHDAVEVSAGFVAGVRGEAVRFDGSGDEVKIPTSELLGPASFTLRAWVRLLANPSPWGAMISNYGADFAGWYVGALGDGRPFFGLASTPSSLPSVVAAAPLALDRWACLTVTYNGRNQRLTLYVDGTPADSRFVVGMTPRTAGELVLGRASWLDGHHTRFDLDELLVVPAAWSAVEVQADFDSFGAVNASPPLAAWSFDEIGSLFMDAAGGHDAVAIGDPGLPVVGAVNGARRLAGPAGHARVAAHQDLSTSSFSFKSWLRLDAAPPKWGSVFSTYDGALRGWYLAVNPDGRLILCVAGLPDSSPWLMSATALQIGQWHHVAVTFDGTARRGIIYLDGARTASAVFPAWTPSSGVEPTFGRGSWADTAHLAIEIDEAQLYGYELTPGEVEP